MRQRTFWVGAAVFQVAFGLTVFAVTRHYYRSLPLVAPVAAPQADPGRTPPADAFATAFGVAASAPATPAADDPLAISRQADEAFNGRDYARAAQLYEQLLGLDEHNADVLNNLAITLHYLGRSPEALERLRSALEVDPTHQRAWLTMGFVQAQLGDRVSAREALTKAAELGTDARVRESAQTMLSELD